MRRWTRNTWTGLALAACLAFPLFGYASGDHGSMKGHGSMKEMGHDKAMEHGKDMDHSQHMGEDIRDATVDGYKLAYHLIDMEEKMAAMKDRKGMSMKGMDMSQMASHHLMLYIMGSDGKMVSDAKVGFKVEGPGGEQKAMAMAMTDGFGADVNLKEKGTYEIKAKAVFGETTLTDQFKYEVK